VPCNSSMRSRCSLVDILGEDTAVSAECQREPSREDSRIAGYPGDRDILALLFEKSDQ
jgi:hypothetical protein